ncbi:MAG: hypothetical protein AAGA44_07815 [Pseudomonadota bacterium]
MADWLRITVDLGDAGNVDVEARESAGGSLEWRGLDGTTFETWQGGAPRTGQSIKEQIQDVAWEWFQSTRMG